MSSPANAKEGAQSTYCLSLSAPLDQTSHYADILAELEYDDFPAISIHETSDPLIWTLNAYFETRPDLEMIERVLKNTSADQHLSLPSIELKELEDKDWVALVQRGLCPINAGRYFIHGSHDRDLAGHRAGDIEIDAGEAFGTAHHGTTKGCLLALDHLFKNRQSSPSRNVLDLGTGTGLLAIAAAKVLRQKVLASDIDPVSVKVARQNAALNTVGPLVKVVEANGLTHQLLRKSAPYDLMIANILAPPLLALAPGIAKSLKPQGLLILSGLLQTQSRAIEARYRGLGFNLVKRLPIEEWMTLILRYK